MKTFLTSTSPLKGSMPPIYKVPGHFPHIGEKEADLSDWRKKGQCGKAEERQRIFSRSNSYKQQEFGGMA